MQNPTLVNPWLNTTLSRKLPAFNTQPFDSILVMGNERHWWAGSNFNDKHAKFGSFRESMDSGQSWEWANKLSSAGSGRMWAQPQWGFKNDEDKAFGKDDCVITRIGVCHQTQNAHTGGGPLLGNACGSATTFKGKADWDHFAWAASIQSAVFDTGYDHRKQTWTCAASPTLDFPVEYFQYYAIFVR